MKFKFSWKQNKNRKILFEGLRYFNLDMLIMLYDRINMSWQLT